MDLIFLTIFLYYDLFPYNLYLDLFDFLLINWAWVSVAEVFVVQAFEVVVFSFNRSYQHLSCLVDFPLSH